MKKAVLPGLLLSLLCNVILFFLFVNWQKAWFAQVRTTIEIELIYRESGSDITFESMQKKLTTKYPGIFKVVPLDPSDIDFINYDDQVIETSSTKFFFYDSKYVGSKANLENRKYLMYSWFIN